MGSLLPSGDDPSKFAQLYISDAGDEVASKLGFYLS
jgi:hypothetical protein